MTEPTSLRGAVRRILDAATPESLGALHGSVVGRILQPAQYGGFAAGADEFVLVVGELAAVDGSLGWLTAMCNAAADEVARLPAHAANEVWKSDPNALVATSYHAEGVFADDHRLTGRWTSVIGAEYANWLLLPATNGVACRVLVPRGSARIEPVDSQAGLPAAGVCDVTVSELAVDQRYIFTSRPERTAVVAGAGTAAAVVGSADGVWHKHVDQARTRLATSYGGDEVTVEAAAQVAWAASDIDAAKLQVTTSLQQPDDVAGAVLAHRQAVARARGAADRLLGSSRHALDASDPVTRLWRDVHAGARLAVQHLDGLERSSQSLQL
ncbi:3-hydroxy-9,10-secoandrosta-1,3,5(10)-triene-9,17-dione monooxygenase [Mycobacterium frederiksbergense]|uniref:3-hydroxy-9,10-secoandrosta-1,3,5(10)-triene-9, 17-dione monooxygenase n=1 Tax=Mycolicibacterium frederiksbergense TaxID=117567 RepID=A0ABT6L174_9MYCO|nr:hypothetical protein [Mycolicibacterium frederiksbergense]MDH6196030.1 3-hydroxy-9,10-secoandrosta-1,3,5(10)-triene-9,17-dione monooxygenase [Mycolicibacterium frederiksbergense]